MSCLVTNNHLLEESQLLRQSKQLTGLSFAQLSQEVSYPIPSNPVQRKGWTGMAVEMALGGQAASKSLPDFPLLGIELKTIPINHLGRPAESTFITSIALKTIHHEQWEQSQCYLKLKKILWVPLEGDERIPFAQRRIGSPFLWSANSSQEKILKKDWEELSAMIGLGRLATITASMGEYLQVRPKAAHAKALCEGYDEEGQIIQTLPRGFYLRARFTATILESIKK